MADDYEASSLNDVRVALRERIMGRIEANSISEDQAITIWAVLELDATLQTIADHLYDIDKNTTRI